LAILTGDFLFVERICFSACFLCLGLLALAFFGAGGDFFLKAIAADSSYLLSYYHYGIY